MSITPSHRSYKATFIFDTRGLEEPIEALIQKVKDSMTQLKASLGHAELLGLQSFSRVTDRHFPAGHYFQIEFNGASSLPSSIKERFKLDKFINRIFIESL
jgi:ribosomal protein S6